MDTFFSAILGELAGRSLSFLIDRCSSKPLPRPPAPAAASKEEKIQRLERMLLRLTAAIEEAERWRITNHATLRQVSMLRQDIHKGYYLLDTFRFVQSHDEKEITNDDGDDEVSNNLALSRFNSAKRARVPTGSRRHGDGGEIEQMVDNVGIAMANMVEFVLLLNNYPTMRCQPYDTYMFMDKCLFGRQIEVEHIINFLLQLEPPKSIGVLPIIGPAKVGKSTLVEYVCNDERVRNHFSEIIFLTDNDFKEEKSFFSLRDTGVIRHKHSSSSSASNGEAMSFLVVVELAEDVDDYGWRKMYSSCQSCISVRSKIIITSWSKKIAKLGTTHPLHLKLLSREAYWYYFKVLAFGSSNPEEHPEVASVSMDIFNGYFDHQTHEEFTRPFIDLSNMASFIHDTVYDGSWVTLHERVKAKAIAQQSLLSRGLGDSGLKIKLVPIPRMDRTVKYYCEIYNHCRVGFAHEEDHEDPIIDIQDILSGRVAPNGKFDLVLWRSHLPPYYSYIYSCEIHEYKSTATCWMGLRQKRKI